MTGAEYLVGEIKKYRQVCYYPSSGTDLSDMDFFGSGQKLFEERRNPEEIFPTVNADETKTSPDLFIHTDVNFYQEFEEAFDFPARECGINGSFEILDFRELPLIKEPNLICDNYIHSGKIFEYKLRLWNSPEVKTLIYCLCENEFFVSRIAMAHDLKIPLIWTKNWNGGKTYGTWLVNVFSKLQTQKFYSDWLCIAGHRGEPRNRPIEEKYPELMTQPGVKLVRNNDIHWIEEGAHGWVEEFDVVSSG